MDFRVTTHNRFADYDDAFTDSGFYRRFIFLLVAVITLLTKLYPYCSKCLGFPFWAT
jgi:hypothetical protein